MSLLYAARRWYLARLSLGFLWLAHSNGQIGFGPAVVAAAWRQDARLCVSDGGRSARVSVSSWRVAGPGLIACSAQARHLAPSPSCPARRVSSNDQTPS